MTKNALNLLDILIKHKSTRGQRETTLLKNPISEFAEGWYMLVKPCFNNALDIQITEVVKNKISRLVWTQGQTFTFDIGDVLYVNQNMDRTYLQPNLTHYIQIQSASNVTPQNKDNDRFPGSVFFWEMVYNLKNQNLEMKKDWIMSQDDFVRFLIIGPP